MKKGNKIFKSILSGIFIFVMVFSNFAVLPTNVFADDVGTNWPEESVVENTDTTETTTTETAEEITSQEIFNLDTTLTNTTNTEPTNTEEADATVTPEISSTSTEEQSVSVENMGEVSEITSLSNLSFTLPLNHTCAVPNSLDDTIVENVVKGFDTVSLQDIFNSDGINQNVISDQKQYQEWNVAGKTKVNVTIENLGGVSAYNSVFGYYLGHDKVPFVPVFASKTAVGSTTVFAEGQSTTFDIDTKGAASLGFVIEAFENPNFSREYATNNSLNGGNDKVVVYEVAQNTFILGFEDLVLADSDKDYNDVIVKVTFNGCSDGTTNPPTNTPPVITLLGNNPFIISAGTPFVDPGATATDTEDGDITSSIIKTGTVNTSTLGTTTLTYTVTDSDGLSASTTRTVVVTSNGGVHQCTINVVSDTTNQVVGDGFAKATYNENPLWTASIPGATWIWKTFFVPNPLQDEFQTFTKTFNIVATSTVDSASLVMAADNSYTVSVNGTQVGADNTEFNYFNENKDTYNVAAFLKNGTNTISFTVKNWALANSTAQTNPAGLLYKLTILTHDTNCGEVPTNTPPLISLVGSNPLILTVDDVFVDPGATATDTQDGDLTSNIVKTGSVDTSIVSTSTIVYSVTDSDGLSASTTRTVIVKPKVTPPDNGGGGSTNTPPTITLIGNNPFNIFIGDTFTDPGATATDAEDGQLTSSIVVSGSVSTSTLGTTTLTYSVVDSGGLGATTTRQVIVLATTTPPVSKPQCSDTVDNDGDGKVDSADPGCHSDGDTDNDSSFDPNDNDETDPTPPDNGGGGNGGNGGGGGGGSSSSGGRRHDISNLLSSGGEVLGASSCSYLRDYLRIDWANDKIEVLKLQSFLNIYNGASLSLTGVFDQNTLVAVNNFQDKYESDILTPWGHEAPTGFVYILTKKKINEIYCNTTYSLTPEQAQEIRDFRAFLESLKANNPGATAETDGIGGDLEGGVGSGIAIGEDGEVLNLGSTTVESNLLQNDSFSSSVLRNAAVSIFAVPDNVLEGLKCLIAFLIILLVMYIVSGILANGRKERRIVFIILSVLAILVSMFVAFYCIVLPLIVALIIALVLLFTDKGEDVDIDSGTPENDAPDVLVEEEIVENINKEVPTDVSKDPEVLEMPGEILIDDDEEEPVLFPTSPEEDEN